MASEIVLDIAARAVEFLTRQGVDYVLIGGLALQPWGRIRSTLDVDMIALVPETDLSTFQEALWASGFILRHAAPTRLGESALIQTYVEHADSGLEIRVDFLVAGSAFHRRVVQRRVPVEINGYVFHISSCEDLILLKLLAGRPIDRLESFRRWARSGEMPEHGWFSYLNGEVWVDLSKEPLFSHNQVKTEFAQVLGDLVDSEELGYLMSPLIGDPYYAQRARKLGYPKSHWWWYLGEPKADGNRRQRKGKRTATANRRNGRRS